MNIKGVTLTLSAVCALIGSLHSASANTYVVEQTPSHYIACYHKVYVPERVLVNTRGVLVNAGHVDWEVSGDSWNRIRNPPVYLETRHVIEGDHYSLQSVACP